MSLCDTTPTYHVLPNHTKFGDIASNSKRVMLLTVFSFDVLYGENIGHSETFYHTKFGNPASKSIKHMFWTRFSFDGP